MSGISGYIFFSIIGYISGSILYASILPKYICHIDPASLSDDKNPGAFNAFKYAGKKIGILVIVMELLKGALPVFISTLLLDSSKSLFALVITAPVLGHAFPLFNHFKGGKAIAVSFGVLIGLFPNFHPLIILALFYMLFSVVIIIEPHLHRTIVTFICFCISGFFYFKQNSIIYGCALISIIVVIKHLMKYEKEPASIRLFFNRNR